MIEKTDHYILFDHGESWLKAEVTDNGIWWDCSDGPELSEPEIQELIAWLLGRRKKGGAA